MAKIILPLQQPAPEGKHQRGDEEQRGGGSQIPFPFGIEKRAVVIHLHIGIIRPGMINRIGQARHKCVGFELFCFNLGIEAVFIEAQRHSAKHGYYQGVIYGRLHGLKNMFCL